MAETKAKFSWCRLILWILSAFLAAWLANMFIKPALGNIDALWALLVFLGLFFLFIWLSSFICGLFSPKSSKQSDGLGLGAATAATAGGAAAATASTRNSERSDAKAKPVFESEPEVKKSSVDASKERDDDTSAPVSKLDSSAKPSDSGDRTDDGNEETLPRNLITSGSVNDGDNLKEIKGVGPGLEQLCHNLGIFYFRQIAEWKRDEIAWMDSNLEGFHGRVTRDDWVGQAKILASGGETEFSKRVEDGDVY